MEERKVKIFSMSGMPVSGKSTVIKTMTQQLIEHGYNQENIHVFSVGKRFREYFNKVVMLASNIENNDVLKEISEDEDMKRIFSDPSYRKELERTIVALKASGYDFNNHDIEKANNSEEFAGIRNVIDHIVDDDVKELGKRVLDENNPDEVWIMDSRLAFSNIPESFAVRLTVRDDIAAKRLLGDNLRGKEDRNYSSEEEAKQKIVERKKGEEERYKETYNVDLTDPDNYDLIIDTSFSSIEDVAEAIIKCEELYRQGKKFSKTWASPKIFLPMQREKDTLYRGFGGYTIDDMKDEFRQNGYDPTLGGIDVFKYEDKYYIYEGHHRNFAYAAIGKTLIPYEELPLDEETKKQRVKYLNKSNLYGHEGFFDIRDEDYNVIESFSYGSVYPGIYKELDERDNTR